MLTHCQPHASREETPPRLDLESFGSGSPVEPPCATAREIKSLVRHIIRDEKPKHEAAQPWATRLADAVSEHIGRWSFIGAVSAFTAGWMGVNAALGRIFQTAPDPFPFPLANLGFALIGALTGPVILMSQERKERREREHTAEYQQLALLRARLLLAHPEVHDSNLRSATALEEHLATKPDYDPAQARPRSRLERFTDRAADYLSSWAPVTHIAGASAAWIVVNEAVRLAGWATLDPYPYIFLNLALSALSALTAPIVMMAHRRQSERDERRAAWFHRLEVLSAKLDVELAKRRPANPPN